MVIMKSVGSIIVICSVFPLLLVAEPASFRLPNNTIPKLYKLDLNPHIDGANFTFDGNSSTLFEVLEPTDTVTVQASDSIDIEKDYTKILCSNGTIIKPVSQEWDSTTELLDVKFDHTLPIGEYTIEFKWEGREGPDEQSIPRGFTRRSVEVNGNSENVIATVFEPIGARCVFPCWDEPAFKSEFSLSVKHNPRYKAISNMPAKETIPIDNEAVWTVFEQSPPMATYHLNVVVGIYEGMTNEHKNMTYWTQPDKIENLEFLAKLSPLIVAALENYTGVNYYLPKLDSVHVHQYPGSANEHWGAITYSDDCLREPGPDHSNDYHIAQVISHEISHQWFGNLVTPKWWNDLWLAEGFATYFSYKILDNVNKKWNAKDLYSTGTVNLAAFNTERGSRHKNSITWMPDKLETIVQKFESIVYQKGSGVIQMLEHVLSDDIFQSGIRKYFSKHKVSSVTTDDMWESLQEAYDESQPSVPFDVKETINPWLTQKGHPLLNVTRDYETGIVTITQEDAVYPNSSTRWRIPITFTTASELNFEDTTITHWIESTMSSLEIPGIAKDDWIILNIQLKDFYQVFYDFENWKRIVTYLNTEDYHKIHVLHRAQLFLNVIQNYERDEEESNERMIDIMSYLFREIHPLPWKFSVDAIELLADDLRNTPVYEPYKKFALHLLNNITESIGFDDREEDDLLTRLARSQIVPLACNLGHKTCQDIEHAKLIKYINEDIGKPIDYEKLGRMYQTGLSTANETNWDVLLEAYITDSVDVNPLIHLGSSNNQTLINKYLLQTLNNSSFVNRTMFENAFWSLMMGSGGNYEGTLDFVINHIDEIVSYCEATNSTDMEEYVSGLVSNAKTLNHQEKLTKFINEQDNKIGNSEKLLKTLVTKVESAVKFSNIVLSIMNRKAYFKEFLEEAEQV